MSFVYNYLSSWFSYYGSYGRSAPTEDTTKLKALIQNKAIFVVSEEEIVRVLNSLRKVQRNPKIIKDTRPKYLQDIEDRVKVNI